MTTPKRLPEVLLASIKLMLKSDTVISQFHGVIVTMVSSAQATKSCLEVLKLRDTLSLISVFNKITLTRPTVFTLPLSTRVSQLLAMYSVLSRLIRKTFLAAIT